MLWNIAGGRDVVLLTPSLVFPPEQRLLTNISLQFVTDGVAQELNETFTITFTGEEPMDLEFGATVIREFTGTIVDVDGEYRLIAKKNEQNRVALLSTWPLQLRYSCRELSRDG